MNQIADRQKLGPKPEFAWIDIDSLCINHKYQRQIGKDGQAMIRRIAREFDWRRFTPVTVTATRDNPDKYFVIDGQHRVNAALNLDCIETIPCWIIDAPEIADQADAFVGLNKNRIKMMPVNIFQAELAAGTELAIAVAKACSDVGVTISRSHVSTLSLAENETMAVAAMKKVVQNHGQAVLTRTLGILKDSLTGINPMRAATIHTLARLLALEKIHPDINIDPERLKTVLRRKDVDQWIEDASAYTRNFGGGMQTALRAAWIHAYNAAGRAGKLPE